MQKLTEEDIISIIQNDLWMMSILQTVQTVHLPDWWIGAGFVRGKVWDYLHGYTTRTSLPDIDVIYFEKNDVSKQTEKEIQQKLFEKMPQLAWQVKNQARMHVRHNDEPYKNAAAGLSRWVETATCIGVRLDDKNQLALTAPLEIDDLVNLIVRHNPTIPFDKKLFEKRIQEKQWLTKWPKLKVVY